MSATLTIFKMVAVLCAAGTSHDDCRISAPGAQTFYGSESNSAMECIRSGPPQLAQAVAQGQIDIDGKTVSYYCPVWGEGKISTPDYGVVSEPHVEVFQDR